MQDSSGRCVEHYKTPCIAGAEPAGGSKPARRCSEGADRRVRLTGGSRTPSCCSAFDYAISSGHRTRLEGGLEKRACQGPHSRLLIVCIDLYVGYRRGQPNGGRGGPNAPNDVRHTLGRGL